MSALLQNYDDSYSWVDGIQPAYDENGGKNFLDENGELVAGIYTDLENDVYHSLNALSSSGLKTSKKSMAHYYRNYKSDIERKRTTTMTNTLDTGTLAHELILEPEKFYEHWARDIKPSDFDESTLLVTVDSIKKYLKENSLKVSGSKDELIKRCFDHDPDCNVFGVKQIKHRLENSGKTIVDAIVWDDAHRIQKSHLNNPMANWIVSEGYAELTMIAKCPETDMWLKVKFDYIREDGIASDVKTSRCANPAKFARQCADLHYDYQQVFYTYVANLCGVTIEAFSFIVIEYAEADICEVMEISERRISKVQSEFMESIMELQEAIETDTWTGYNKKGGVTVIDIPDYL